MDRRGADAAFASCGSAPSPPECALSSRGATGSPTRLGGATKTIWEQARIHAYLRREGRGYSADPSLVGRRLEIMTTHPLPSDRFPLAVHLDVLRRFMAVSRNGAEAVTPEVVEAAGLPPGAAQLNVGFLADSGLVVEEAAGRFKPTPVAMQLINTLSLDDGRGRRLLRSVVAKLWFGRVADGVLRATPGAGSAELTSRLATEADGSGSPSGRSVQVLLEYLRYTGLLGAEPSNGSAPERAGRPVEPLPGASARTKRTEPRSPRSKDRSRWRSIQAEDFELRVRPNHDSIHRLRRQLDILDEELSATDPTVGT